VSWHTWSRSCQQSILLTSWFHPLGRHLCGVKQVSILDFWETKLIAQVALIFVLLSKKCSLSLLVIHLKSPTLYLGRRIKYILLSREFSSHKWDSYVFSPIQCSFYMYSRILWLGSLTKMASKMKYKLIKFDLFQWCIKIIVNSIHLGCCICVWCLSSFGALSPIVANSST